MISKNFIETETKMISKTGITLTQTRRSTCPRSWFEKLGQHLGRGNRCV